MDETLQIRLLCRRAFLVSVHFMFFLFFETKKSVSDKSAHGFHGLYSVCFHSKRARLLLHAKVPDSIGLFFIRFQIILEIGINRPRKFMGVGSLKGTL